MNSNCSDCNCPNLLFCEGYMWVCTECGIVQDYVHFVEEHINDDMKYHIKKDPKYKCITYFKRVLRCMQDKSKGKIPDEILQLVRNEPDLTIREVLKKHKLFDYYIRIPQIDYMINKNTSFSLTNEEEDKLNKLFIVVANEVHRKFPDRNQIIRYRPILRKLLPMIGREDLLAFVPDLKNKNSIKRFEEVWAQIDFQ